MALTIAPLWGQRLKPCIVLRSCGLWIVLWPSASRRAVVSVVFVIHRTISVSILLKEIIYKKN